MNKVFITLGVIVGAFAVLALLIGASIWGMYNGMVTQNESVTASWSKVESQYQRRFDLIPGLVNATKGVLRQEQAVFGAIAEARTHYAGTQPGSTDRVQATNQMESALARLMVIVENYPQLKSDQTVRGLMDELAGTENRITVARDRYNEEVLAFNVQIKVFPRSFLAGMFGFKERPFFKSEETANKAVPVNLEL